MLWFYEAFFPVVWIFFLLYWQIKAANPKSTQRLEPAASRILRVFIFLIAIVLLSTTRIPLPFLYLQLWPAGLWPFWLGAAVTIAGLLFAVRARQHLRSNWSRSDGEQKTGDGDVRGPRGRGPFWVGAAVPLAGLLFAVWARQPLGSNWSRSDGEQKTGDGDGS